MPARPPSYRDDAQTDSRRGRVDGASGRDLRRRYGPDQTVPAGGAGEGGGSTVEHARRFDQELDAAAQLGRVGRIEFDADHGAARLTGRRHAALPVERHGDLRAAAQHATLDVGTHYSRGSKSRAPGAKGTQDFMNGRTSASGTT